MAVVSVNLTSESLAHLMHILDEVIDDRQPDFIANGTPRPDGTPTRDFRPLVEILHYMVAGTNAVWNPVMRTLTLNAPTLAEQTAKVQLDQMLTACAGSITAMNNQVNNLVLKV
jgi:hypothetical protein